MFSVPLFRYVFTCRYWIFFLALLLISTLCFLGFWQLARADEKKAMLAAYTRYGKQAAINWDGATLPEQYQAITIKGTMLPDVFFLDNQHRQHQFGYDVLGVVQTRDALVLVDRGWIAGNMDRQHWPDIKQPAGANQWSGRVWYPGDGGLVLGQAWEQLGNQRYVIEQARIKYFQEILQKKVYPFIIRLDAEAEHGFLREWATVSMPPERHQAYALQWFSMAFVLLVLLVALNIKRR